MTGTVPGMLSDARGCGGGGTSFNRHSAKTLPGAQTASWPLPSIADIMAAAFQRTSCLSRGHPLATSPVAPICQERVAKFRHQMNSRNRLANPAATYSTTSSDPSLDAQTIKGIRFTEESSNLHRAVAEPAHDDVDADADSEAESDTSQYFDSGSEDNDGPEDEDDGVESSLWDGEELGTYGWIDYCRTEGNRYAMDDQNDTLMTNMEPPSSPVFTQTTLPAITNSKKKPRRCKLSRKHYGADGFAGTQRPTVSPAVLASGMDIDMDAPAQVDQDNYCTDSSADEDLDGYAYSNWFGGIYHPMWLGHTAASGKKRRDNGREGDAENDGGHKAAELSGSAAEVEKRHIKLPSLSRRKRAWKASQGTRSSVGESEWSLTVNHPMPQSSGTSTGVISSPPMTPATIVPKTKPVHAAPRKTQSGRRQNPARALERRLENLRVEDLNRQSSTATTISTTMTMTPAAAAAAANDSRPRVSPDQHESKRLRHHETTSSEIARMETPGGGVVVTPPVFWDIVEEQPMGMDFSPSGADGQWHTQGFEMIGIETSMSSAMDGVMQLGVSERAKDISRILDDVDGLL